MTQVLNLLRLPKVITNNENVRMAKSGVCYPVTTKKNV